jgi:hypothetical protein
MFKIKEDLEKKKTKKMEEDLKKNGKHPQKKKWK